MVRAERYWRQALVVSDRAERCGDLVPLQTRALALDGTEPFLLRELLSSTPRHLRPEGPRPNPFLPWEQGLEVARPSGHHALILNKYPVQRGHLLLITSQWQPQNGWIGPPDWASVASIACDTGGLWFFNSQATAGASQPHRHLQLLPRHPHEASCPLAEQLKAQLEGVGGPWPWAYALSRRHTSLDPQAMAQELELLYHRHAAQLGLGSPETDPRPREAYNLLFDDTWFLTVKRRREHCAGFSVNALGFAGYLLRTGRSDLDWLARHGPWTLLQEVASPRS